MAKKKKSSTTTKRRASYGGSKRRTYRKKADTSYIPAAAATAGLLYANMQPIRTAVTSLSVDGMKSAAREAVQPEQLKKTAIYTVGGMIAGEAVKRFAPGVIKKPLGKVAKKMPRVF